MLGGKPTFGVRDEEVGPEGSKVEARKAERVVDFFGGS